MSIQWTVGKKLIAGFSSVAVITLIVAMMGLYAKTQLAENLTLLGESRIPDLQYLAILNTERMAVRAQTLEVFLEENSEQQAATDAYRRIQTQRAQSWERVDAAIEGLRSIPRLTDRGRGLIERVDREYRAWREIYRDLDRLIEQMATSRTELQRAQLYRQYREVMERMIPISDRMGQAFDDLTLNNNTNTNRLIDEALAEANVLTVIFTTTGIIGVLLALGLGILLTRNISSALGRLADELGNGARQVSSASGQVAASSQSQAEGASEQASSLEQTSSALEQMASQTRLNAENADQADRAVKETAKIVESGVASMSRMNKAIAEIRSSAVETSKIIKTIDEIAFQTDRKSVV